MAKKDKSKTASPEAGEPVVTAYKGFTKDWKCNDYQYEVGKTFEHPGKVERCATGFHSCENPIDVFLYYVPGESRYAIVEASGQIDREENGDTKLASAKIHIKAELQIPAIVTAAIAWITSKAKPADVAHSEGSRSASSATGDSSASSATGDRSASSVEGKNAVAMNIGILGKAKAGKDGAIVLCNHDAEYNIRHIRASKVGENGIKPDVWYVLNASGEFEESAT